MNSGAIVQHITHWLKDYAHHAGMKGFVVGVSGGVDSAVVSTLAALTGMKTLLLTMPIRQDISQNLRAEHHMQVLARQYENVHTLSVDLTPTFNQFYQTVDVSEHDFPSKQLALANARSRLRMTTLYYYGQIHHLLVTGTGNKVEDFGVGFFTKYGDGGVDISPIADLTKTQVYTLAKHLNVSSEIIQAAPTDGLWDEDKTDEQQMGASYPELEWAMSMADTHVSSDFSGRQREVFDIFMRLNRAMQHKIKPIPVCQIPQNLLTKSPVD